jgi:excisionase family DNA binding protein
MRKEAKRLTYTVEEAAALLGISRGTAYDCVRSGAIPSLTFGRRIVIPRDAFDQPFESLNRVRLSRATRRRPESGVQAGSPPPTLTCANVAVSALKSLIVREESGRFLPDITSLRQSVTESDSRSQNVFPQCPQRDVLAT